MILNMMDPTIIDPFLIRDHIFFGPKAFWSHINHASLHCNLYHDISCLILLAEFGQTKLEIERTPQ